MPPSNATILIKDGGGGGLPQLVVDTSGAGTGPFVPVQGFLNSEGTGRFDMEAAMASLKAQAESVADQVAGAQRILVVDSAGNRILSPSEPSGKAPMSATVTTAPSATVTGRTDSFLPIAGRPIVLTVRGLTLGASPKGWIGTVQLDRSFDMGSNWHPATLTGRRRIFSIDISEPVWEETEAGVLLSLSYSVTNSQVTFRLSQ